MWEKTVKHLIKQKYIPINWVYKQVYVDILTQIFLLLWSCLLCMLLVVLVSK